MSYLSVADFGGDAGGWDAFPWIEAKAGEQSNAGESIAGMSGLHVKLVRLLGRSSSTALAAIHFPIAFTLKPKTQQAIARVMPFATGRTDEKPAPMRAMLIARVDHEARAATTGHQIQFEITLEGITHLRTRLQPSSIRLQCDHVSGCNR